jgi:excisionase family DNA binding protein
VARAGRFDVGGRIYVVFTPFSGWYPGGVAITRDEAKAVARRLLTELADSGRATEAEAIAALAGDSDEVYLRLRKRHYTPSEVAERVGVSRQTVIKWIERGELEAELTPGGHHRIPASVFQSGRRAERADIRLIPAKR